MIKEELILQYLDKTISAEDAVLVQDWAAKNPEDFRLMQAIWGVDTEASEIHLFDEDLAWDSFSNAITAINPKDDVLTVEKIKQDAEPVTPVKKVEFWKGWTVGIIAAVVLLFAIAIYLLWPTEQVINYYADKNSDEVTLPDETVVTLEEGSQIKYYASFENKDRRIVSLEGKGVFDVATDTSKPFIVETETMGVKAIGTVFEVDALDTVKTSVKNIEGLIRFFELADEAKFVDVKEGESFQHDANGFKETTPLPAPKVFNFSPPPVPYHTVREVVDNIFTLSGGNAVAKGDAFDWQKEIQVDLTIDNLDVLLQTLNKKASLTLLKKDCSDCYEILRFRVN